MWERPRKSTKYSNDSLNFRTRVTSIEQPGSKHKHRHAHALDGALQWMVCDSEEIFQIETFEVYPKWKWNPSGFHNIVLTGLANLQFVTANQLQKYVLNAGPCGRLRFSLRKFCHTCCGYFLVRLVVSFGFFLEKYETIWTTVVYTSWEGIPCQNIIAKPIVLNENSHKVNPDMLFCFNFLQCFQFFFSKFNEVWEVNLPETNMTSPQKINLNAQKPDRFQLVPLPSSG